MVTEKKPAVKSGIDRCVELVCSGLEGRKVTVAPVNSNGYPQSQYEAVFVRWARGYNRVDLPMPTQDLDPATGMIKEKNVMMPTLGEVDDAIVMREDGSLEVASVRAIKFRL